MNPDRRYLIASLLATAVVTAIFFALAVSHSVYAPGARTLQQHLAATDDYSTFLNSPGFGQAVYFLTRKTYGFTAFLIVATLVAPMFARPRRLLRTTVLLFVIRFALEFYEAYHHYHDPTLESVFDVLSGTAAGALGATFANALLRRREARG